MREFFDYRDERRRRPPRALAQGPHRPRAGRDRRASTSARSSGSRPRAITARRCCAARTSASARWLEGPLHHLERDRARPPDPLDGDRAPARRPSSSRSSSPSRRRRRWSREMGFPVEYVASYATPGSGNDYRWSRRLRGRLRAAIAEAEPAVVVFDGTHPYEALLGALPAEASAVWCRRPLWKAGSSRVPLGRAGAFDAVLEPGELAESEDRGPTVALRDRAHRVGPIVLLDRSELLARERAEAELGLAPRAHQRARRARTGGGGARGDRRCPAPPRRPRGRPGRRALLDPGRGRRGSRGGRPASRHLSDEPLLRRLRRRGRRRRLQRLPRADRARRPARCSCRCAARPTTSPPAPAGPQAPGSVSASPAPSDPGLEARRRPPARRRRARSALATRLAELDPPTGAADAAALARPTSPPPPPPSGRKRPHGATESAARAGSARQFRRRWGQFIASAPRTAVRLTRQQLTKPRARARDPRGRDRPDDELAAAVAAALAESGEAAGAARWSSPTRSRSGRCARSGSGSSTCPARARAPGPSSPAAPMRTSCARGWS